MRKILILFLIPLLFSSCMKHIPEKITINAVDERNAYPEEIDIQPMESVTITSHLITIAPKEEGVTYVISGYYNGQIIVETKNTIIKLKNAYLENTSGKPALRFKPKAEVSTVEGSTNYIISRGRGFAKQAALFSAEDLAIGGSGTLYVQGKICHGIEAEDVRIKGKGTLYAQGSYTRGSALSCRSITVLTEKDFNAYFLNSKCGIKADETITISSGNFYLYNNFVGLKTDIKADNTKKPHGITLLGGNFHTYGNKNLFQTERDGYNNSGATFKEESL